METVTADTLVSDVLASRPDAVEVFSRFGLGCPSCFAAGMESVSAVAAMHDVALDELLANLNTDAGTTLQEQS